MMLAPIGCAWMRQRVGRGNGISSENTAAWPGLRGSEPLLVGTQSDIPIDMAKVVI